MTSWLPIHTALTWQDVLHPAASHDVLRLLERCRLPVQPAAKGETLPCTILLNGFPATHSAAIAALAGKELGADTYRIDLSGIVSKYIGETEKNLERLFKEAAGRNWVLLLDEADALFGKRTDIKAAGGRYEEPAIAMLLDWLKRWPHPVICSVCRSIDVLPVISKRFSLLLTFDPVA